MKPERWRQIDKILQDVLERTPQERAAFLDQACADDPSLRKQVEALIRSHESAGSFLDSPALELSSAKFSPEESRLEGRTVSHYRILDELGRGGMGIVYRAEDTKLQRTVALKFLPPELTRDEDAKQRFMREARAASALDHPNLCTIYEIDESSAGQLFLSMACYEGETLRQRIGRGPLSTADALDFAMQVAQGLRKAHEAGIFHRDVKPANLFVTTDGIVKILDFGLAKLAGQTRLTHTGTMLGTVAYMAPEQIQGSEAGEQSDLWALGVVLYEMVTGQLQAALTGPRPTVDVTTVSQFVRKPRFAVPATIVLLAGVAVAGWAWSRAAGARWARGQAIPEIAQLVERGSYPAAFELAQQAVRYVPDDPMLRWLTPEFAATFSVTTTPPGAGVSVRAYEAAGDKWEHLGRTPLVNVRLPRRPFRWKIEMAGFESAELATTSQADRVENSGAIQVTLHKAGVQPPEMVFVPKWAVYQDAGYHAPRHR